MHTNRYSHQPNLATTSNDEAPQWARQLLAEIVAVKESLRENRKQKLTVEEVAELTGRSAFTVRRWIKEGLIHADRVQGTGPKGRLIVDRDALDQLMKRGKTGHTPDTAMPTATSASLSATAEGEHQI